MGDFIHLVVNGLVVISSLDRIPITGEPAVHLIARVAAGEGGDIQVGFPRSTSSFRYINGTAPRTSSTSATSAGSATTG